MKRELLASALAKGVEAAARLDFSDARKMLADNDAIVGDVFLNSAGKPSLDVSVQEKGDFARWRVEAIQELKDEKGPCVELSVNSTDGEYEMGVYFYVRDSLPRAS